MHCPAPTTAADPAEDTVQRRLLRDSAAGDRAAFDALYRLHHRRLARFLLRFTARRDLIDDVINDTMWIVWCKAAEFRGDSKVSTWVTGIAWRCMLKALRDHGSAFEGATDHPGHGAGGFDEPEPEDSLPAPDTAAAAEQREWIARGLAALPHDQRVTLELAYFMGESCEDIATIMGCAVGTVKARLFHARVRLRSVLPALGGLKPGPGAAGGEGKAG
jgi:RNA polymerase sigma-70 factor, ECF subfamily